MADEDTNESARPSGLNNQTFFDDNGSIWSTTPYNNVSSVERPYYPEFYVKEFNLVIHNGLATPDTAPPVPPTPPNSPTKPSAKTTIAPPRRPPPPPPPRRPSVAGPSTPSASAIKANTSRKRDRDNVKHDSNKDKNVVARYEVHVNSTGEEMLFKQDVAAVNAEAKDVKGKGKAKEVINETNWVNEEAMKIKAAKVDFEGDTEMQDAFEAAFEEYFDAEDRKAKEAARDKAAAKKVTFVLGGELEEGEIADNNKENFPLDDETLERPKTPLADRSALRPLPLRWKFLEEEDDKAKLERSEVKITLGELLVFEDAKWGLQPYRVRYPTLLRWSYTLKG